jgi:CheY-like chemotaxis protein
MDGLDLCRRLRADAAIRHVVVVVVTGGGAEQDAIAAGCDAVIGKPCSRTSLVGAVQSLLSGRQQPRAEH